VPLFVKLEWPPTILNVLRVAMSIFRLDFIEFGTPECAVKLRWVDRWILDMVLPCVGIGLLFFWRALHKKDDARRTNMTYTIAALLFYLPLPRVVAALKPIRCAASSDPSSGQRVLIYTGEVSCWSTTHVVIMILGIVSAFLFSVAPVLWFAYKLKQHNVDDERIQHRYGFLYEGLSRDCLHWEITYQWAYRVITAVLELRFVPPSIQAFCLLVLDLVMLGVILEKKPFADPCDQRLQKRLQCALIALTAVGILCLYGVLDDGVATVLVVGIFAVKVAAVSQSLWGQWGASETNDDEGSNEDTTTTTTRR
jgi:hypothetical protein